MESYDSWITQINRNLEFMSENMEDIADVAMVEVPKVQNAFADLDRQIVSMAASMAYSFGQMAGGMEDSLDRLAEMITNAIGDILIGAGMSMEPIGWPLVIAGLGMKFASGAMGANINAGNQPGGMYALYRQGDNVVQFEIEGEKLVGVMKRYNANQGNLT